MIGVSEQSQDSKIADFKPRPGDLANTIRHLAQDSNNVGWSDHAQDQMVSRDILDTQALKVLRTGDIEGEIEAGRSNGEWKCKMVAPIKGNRDVGVVTIVCNGKRLFVKTVEWEDMR